MHARRRFVVAAALLAATGAAWAKSVALQGMLGRKALLIIDGGAPRSVAPGESADGVTVVSTQGDEAVVEIAGQRHRLRVGDSPASVGGNATAPGRGSTIVLTGGSGGHFYANGQINGKPVAFVVDTGATLVSMGADEAGRLGIDYARGQRTQIATANGVAPAWRVRLASVRVNDVEQTEVDAVVSQQPLSYVLLGNSFLSRFRMTLDANQMTLVRRY